MTGDEWAKIDCELAVKFREYSRIHSEVWDLILRRLGPAIQQLLRQRFPHFPPSTIEDVWQETLVRFLRGPSGGRVPYSPAYYLLRAADNTLVDLARREKARHPPGQISLSDLPSLPMKPEDPWPEEIRREVWDAMERLAPRQRVILSLYYQLGWKLKEIAGALGLSPSTVHREVHQGVTQLRSWLGVDVNLEEDR